MLNLLLSIIFTIGIVVVFRLAHKVKVNILQTLTANYFACVVLGIIVQGDLEYMNAFWKHDWFAICVLLGSFFIFSFYIFGYSTFTNGVAPTIIANKLSLVITVAAGFFWFGDSNSFLKTTGIVLAIVAVVLASVQKDDNPKIDSAKSILVIIGVFFASGIVDLGLKFMEHDYYDSPYFTSTPVFLYGCSFILGIIALSFQLITGRTKLHPKSLLMGILLGLTNYTSLWFFFKAIHQPGYEISWVLPVNNIAVMLASIAIAYYFFKEKITRLNIFGMILAVIAMGILLISARHNF